MDEVDNICHLFETQARHLIEVVRQSAELLDTKDVHGFLTSMDMVCRHHVRNEKEGFWPFVQEFTDTQGSKYISGLENAITGIGKGRAWLLLALQENTLEFYFTSFLSHSSVRARHYRPGALLRQDARLKRLVVMLAELGAVAPHTLLRVDEYDLERHVCPPPGTSADPQLISTMDVFAAPAGDPHEPLQWSHTGRRSRRSRHSTRTLSTSSRQSSQSSGTCALTAEDSTVTAGVPCGAANMTARTAVTRSSAASPEMAGSAIDVTRMPRDTMLRERMTSVSTPSPEPPEGRRPSHLTGEEAGGSDTPTESNIVDGVVQAVGGGRVLSRVGVDSMEEVPGPAGGGAVDASLISDCGAEKDVVAMVTGAAQFNATLPDSPQVTSCTGDAGESAAFPSSSAAAAALASRSPDGETSVAASCGSSRTAGVGCLAKSSTDEVCVKGISCSGVKDTLLKDRTVVNVSSDGADASQHSRKQGLDDISHTSTDKQASQMLPVETLISPTKDEPQGGQNMPSEVGTQPASESTSVNAAAASLHKEASVLRSEQACGSDRVSSSAVPEGVDSSPSRRPPATSGAPSRVHVSSTEAAVRRRPVRLPGAHSDVVLRPRAAPARPPEKRVTWAGTDKETEAVAALLPPPPERGERGAPEGQEDPPMPSRAPSTLSICSSSCMSAGSHGADHKMKRCSRLYEPAALGAVVPVDKEVDRHIAAEVEEGRRQRASAVEHSALVEINHSLATRLVVSFFRDDEMALPTGFKVLWGDHHSLRPCLLVFTTYRVVLLRRSTLQRPPSAEDTPQQPDAAYDYTSISSIKLAFHEQALALQRPDGSYSRWLWLGDRAETRRLLSHLQAAVGRSPLRPLPPQVYTSRPHLQLYRTEIAYREKRPEILYTSLVYFEDFEVPGETPKLSAQLMYKTQAGGAWNVGHFVLWDTDLLLYPGWAAARGGGAPLDRWSLPAMTACRRLTELSRPHQLRLEAAGRALTLAAPDADTCATWAATVRDIMELTVPAQLPSPRPRSVVLTQRGVFIIEEMAFSRRLTPGYDLCPYGYLVQAAGTLRALNAANADAHGTVHLEFDSVDAAETTGSWRLYFLTISEQRSFLQHLLTAYENRNKRALSVGQISHHMREVCRSGARYVRTRWDGITDC